MTRSKARATAAKDAKGRAIYRGAQGGHFIMKNGKRRYMTPEKLRAAQRAVAGNLARKVTGNAMVALAAAAMKRARGRNARSRADRRRPHPRLLQRVL